MPGWKAKQIAGRGAFIAAGLIAMSIGPIGAVAKIRCEGAYQVTSSGTVSTPYCEAENLARVAQSRGIKTSAAAIRGDYSTLKHVCMSLHGDSRVSGTCDLFSESPF